MSEEQTTATEGWRPRVGVRVERHGRAVLAEGGLELLEGIDRCKSISGAARELGISFRHAWATVRQINEAAGEPLVTASTGGIHGGGAALTECGRLAVSLCRGVRERLQQAADAMLPGLLSAAAGRSVVHVAAAVNLEEVLDALATDYALARPGTRVRLVLGASDELAGQILSGAAADLFVTADPRQLDRLAAGIVVEDSVTPLAEDTLAGIGSGGLKGVRRPADLLGAKVRRVALAAPSCPLGGYTRAYLEALGLYDALLERAVVVDHSRAVAGAVRAGQADAGLAYASAASRASGCRVLFRADDLPAPVRYAGAVVRHARQPEEARRFLEFLASEQAAARFRACGFRGVPRRGEVTAPS